MLSQVQIVEFIKHSLGADQVVIHADIFPAVFPDVSNSVRSGQVRLSFLAILVGGLLFPSIGKRSGRGVCACLTIGIVCVSGAYHLCDISNLRSSGTSLPRRLKSSGFLSRAVQGRCVRIGLEDRGLVR